MWVGYEPSITDGLRFSAFPLDAFIGQRQTQRSALHAKYQVRRKSATPWPTIGQAVRAVYALLTRGLDFEDAVGEPAPDDAHARMIKIFQRARRGGAIVIEPNYFHVQPASGFGHFQKSAARVVIRS